MNKRIIGLRPSRRASFVVAVAMAAYVGAAGGALAAAEDKDNPAAAAASENRIVKSKGGKWAKARVLVAPRAGLPEAEFDKLLTAHGAKFARKLNGLDVHVVELPLESDGDEPIVARAFANNPHVKFAEVDEIVSISGTTNDPTLPSEWHINKIGAKSAWDRSTGAGIVIAILDTGVQASHPDLQANMVAGWNVYQNNSISEDVHGHGTAVAGAAAAVGNNGMGVAGVAYRAKIMPIRVTDAAGSTSLSILAKALTWAADHGADVANVSFSNTFKSSTMQAAAQYLRSRGGITVVSANNNGIDERAANTDTMITVSATDANDVRASFSSWGSMVDVAAPGVTIQTTLWRSGYGWGTGTSFSTPIVAGTVALIMSANPGLSPSQVENILFTSATNLGAAGYDTQYGWGRVNAAAAVMAASPATITPSDTSPPSVSIASPAGGTLSGIVPVSVSAGDNVGVTKVDLFVGGTLLASDAAVPYSFSWDTRTRPNGTYGLVAKAYDLAGNVASSSTVNVTVSNAVAAPTPPPPAVTADTTPPTVQISKPTNGAKVSGMVTIAVTGADNVAVKSLSLYIDGALKATGNTGSLSYGWNTAGYSTGFHTIIAIAKDAAGNSRSAAVSVLK